MIWTPQMEEIRLDRLARRDSEDEVLDYLSDSDESITTHAAVAAVQEPKEGQVKAQPTSNLWQLLSKPEFDINLPMRTDTRGNSFGQYVIPPTSSSVYDTIADNTTSHMQTNFLVSTKRPFLTQINDHKDIRRVRDYLATQNLAHDKAMRKIYLSKI